LNGTNGFVINGITALFDQSGFSVSSLGDVNDDGIDDLIVAADRAASEGRSFAGQSYIIFGSSSGFPSPFELSSLNGTNGFIINGIASGDQLGESVLSLGDVNMDGIDDLIIGAPPADLGNRTAVGQSYIILGSSSGFPSPFELSTLDGTNGFTINGIAADDESGRSVSSLGDVNMDGIDDLIVGAPAAGFVGSSYVIFGSVSSAPSSGPSLNPSPIPSLLLPPSSAPSSGPSTISSENPSASAPSSSPSMDSTIPCENTMCQCPRSSRDAICQSGEWTIIINPSNNDGTEGGTDIIFEGDSSVTIIGDISFSDGGSLTTSPNTSISVEGCVTFDSSSSIIISISDISEVSGSQSEQEILSLSMCPDGITSIPSITVDFDGCESISASGRTSGDSLISVFSIDDSGCDSSSSNNTLIIVVVVVVVAIAINVGIIAFIIVQRKKNKEKRWEAAKNKAKAKEHEMMGGEGFEREREDGSQPIRMMIV